MGMYTQLRLTIELPVGIDDEDLEILHFMMGELERLPEIPEHPFFQCGRWTFLFRCDSYYFPADTHCILRFDDIGTRWYLNVQSNLKNYDGEIRKFLDWIAPKIKDEMYDQEFCGFYQYEEDAMPTLLFYDGNGSFTEYLPDNIFA